MKRPSEKPILLAAYGGGHVNIIIPIYHRLKQLGEDPVVLGLTVAHQKLKENDIPFCGVADFLQPGDEDVLRNGRELCSGMALHSDVSQTESAAYMGLSYSELVLDHGAAAASKLFEEYGRQAFLPRRLANRILNALDPKLLITTNSPRMEKALILEASKLGIPTTYVSDFYDEAEYADRSSLPGYGQRVFVALQAAKDKLVELGRPAGEVSVTGNPALDYLSLRSLDSRRRSLRQQKGWQGKRVILWVKSAMATLQESEAAVERVLSSVAKQSEDTIVVARLHPNDPGSDLNLRQMGFVISDRSETILDILLSCDTVCTINSTVGLEANLLGRAVIQVNIVKNLVEHVPYEKLGLGRQVASILELKEVLRNGPSFGLLPPCMPLGASANTVVEESLEVMRLGCGWRYDRNL